MPNFNAFEYSENALNQELVREKLGEHLLGIEHQSKQPVLHVRREGFKEAVQELKESPELAYDYFTDLSAFDRSRMDDFEPEERFQVVVTLYSLSQRRRVRVKTFVPETDPVCPSLSSIFQGANWTEREVYEMFGIRFEGHPHLVRLLTPEYMKDFPLRKEYPVTGKGERNNFPRYEEIQ